MNPFYKIENVCLNKYLGSTSLKERIYLKSGFIRPFFMQYTVGFESLKNYWKLLSLFAMKIDTFESMYHFYD